MALCYTVDMNNSAQDKRNSSNVDAMFPIGHLEQFNDMLDMTYNDDAWSMCDHYTVQFGSMGTHFTSKPERNGNVEWITEDTDWTPVYQEPDSFYTFDSYDS
jgi:hypothetical protein